MHNPKFNLLTDKWIQVFDSSSNQVVTVSLEGLFRNATKYYRICGDMRTQDLVILRLAEAILTTVYTRVDENGNAYGNLQLDEKYQITNNPLTSIKVDSADIFSTWNALYKAKSFTSELFDYLDKNAEKFEIFNDTTSFIQVDENTFNAWCKKPVRAKERKGVVEVKQINRLVNESNNTPSIYAPFDDTFKNVIDDSELARWLLLYDQVAGTTDKNKVVSKGLKVGSSSRGWLFSLRPVFIKGDNLFDTLMLNLKLLGDEDEYIIQRPSWEMTSEEYIARRLTGDMPNNVAEIYTMGSRLMHIDWKNGQSIISTAKLPKVDTSNAFSEPMTVWRMSKKKFIPELKTIDTMDQNVWRSFGLFVPSSGKEATTHTPGIVAWADRLKEKGFIPANKYLTLDCIQMIKDTQGASQMPVAEVESDMKIETDVLFDDSKSNWPKVISAVIENTQDVAQDYRSFCKNLENFIGVEFAQEETKKFYFELNEPFNDWLSGLKFEDDTDVKVGEWNLILTKLAKENAERLALQVPITALTGKGNQNQITAYNVFFRSLHIDLYKERSEK